MNKYHSKHTLMIDHLTLLVKDIDQSLTFYQQTLGLDLIQVENKKHHLGVGNKILFTLITNDHVVSKTKTTGLYHFALLMPQRSDLGSLSYHFHVNKTVVQGGADHGVSEAIYLSDPDGNGIEIYVDKKDASWPINQNGLAMISEPLPFEEIVQTRLTNQSFKMPLGTIIGHLHFHVKNLLEAKTFFIDVIGFELMQAMTSAVFVSDDKYHHHLGFNIWKGTHILNRPDDMVGLVDYHLNVSVEKEAALIKRLNEHEIKIHHDEGERYFYDINHVKVSF